MVFNDFQSIFIDVQGFSLIFNLAFGMISPFKARKLALCLREEKITAWTGLPIDNEAGNRHRSVPEAFDPCSEDS